MRGSRVIIAWAILAATMLAQGRGGTADSLRPVEDDLFHNCDQIKIVAQKLGSEIPDHSYALALYPKTGRSLYFPFLSDGPKVPIALNWVANYEPPRSPYAFFYSLNGAYAFRCRDDQNHISESPRPGGNPLQLKTGSGSAVIWHFYITPVNVAHVFVVSPEPLESLDAAEIVAEVKERLDARVVFLSVRNDPWFLGSSVDTFPFIFTDSFKRLTEEEYRTTRTMMCSSFQKCVIRYGSQ